jgi:hypothetical protein
MREVWRHRTTARRLNKLEKQPPSVHPNAQGLRLGAPWESPMCHFANEGHSAVAETAQGCKGDGAQSVTWTVVIREVLVQLFLVPAPGSATGSVGGASHVAGSKRMDESDIPSNVTGPRPDVALEVPTSPGTVDGAGAPAQIAYPGHAWSA